MIKSAHTPRARAYPRQKLLSAALAVLMLTACGKSEPPAARDERAGGSAASAEAPESAEHASPTDWFVDQAQQAGINFSYFNGMSGEYYFPEMLPGGVALFDYDNDGDLDVFLTQGQMLGEGRTLAQALIPPVGPEPLRA